MNRYQFCSRLILFAALALFIAPAWAGNKFTALRAELADLKVAGGTYDAPTARLVEELVDCTGIPSSRLMELSAHQPSRTQYIYNSVYHWTTIRLSEGLCIYLISPLNRGLGAEEAFDLLSASQTAFPLHSDNLLQEEGLPPPDLIWRGAVQPAQSNSRDFVGRQIDISTVFDLW